MTTSTSSELAIDSKNINENLLNNSPMEETLDTVDFPKISAMQLAWQDVVDGLKKWRIWYMLAYQDIKLRYRRSVLGPFWISISMAITVYSMGFLYGHLFHLDLQQYYPFLVAGMLTWTLIATVIIELTDGLTMADGLIKQIKLPYTLYMHRIAMRNILIFFHNLIVMVPILILFHKYAKLDLHILLLIPGLLIIYLNTLSYGLIIGMIGARYRDVSQIIKSLIQVVFFVTPVLWSPNALNGHSHYFVDLNPFYALIELIRAPLIGYTPTLTNIISVTIVTAIGLLLSSLIFTRYRSRIVYWL